jgi:DNA-binding transcriptional regulator LsrR (DeoR family)
MITPAQLQEPIEVYQGGMSVRGVAQHLGIAQYTVTRMLIEAGARRAR